MGCLKEALDKICSETRLIEINQDGVGRDAPCKVNSQKPFHHAHEIHLALLSQETTEYSFDSRVFREVQEVIDIEAKGTR